MRSTERKEREDMKRENVYGHEIFGNLWFIQAFIVTDVESEAYGKSY